jgi:hypothetical protein
VKISVKLIPNWRDVLRWAWSVRLFALSILLQAADVVLSTRGAFSDNPDTRIALQLLGVACAAAGLVARFVHQRNLNGSS